MIDFQNIENIENGQIKITILYDNYVVSEDLKAGWGFSCFIEGTEKAILFDTGGDGDILSFNINKLNINLKDMEYIIISHNHWDHTGGLPSIL
ncbi:MBL fold metallo-hydrolase, partial [candidate division KSB1 bacterium]